MQIVSYGQRAGKILDPLADKLTQLAMLFCLLTRFPILLVPFALYFICAVRMLRTGNPHKAPKNAA